MFELSTMNLREHPPMRYRGGNSWPLTWVWRGVGENKHPTGEVGVLQEVRPTVVAGDRFYLIIEYEGAEYMGGLLIQDYSFVSTSTICYLSIAAGAFGKSATSTLRRFDRVLITTRCNLDPP